ncbi:hypothetical protein HMPREF0765_4173 [Sphingobacterium spiritivorum ATCC 33300]|uniref:Uncharacterized protein n=1 Tax=Sphingobacterium spiritivorum ATCC 33300 TaxID=525372 RepID=C2G3L7_SPHSI|nr:hypothetical protein [Sphingobacterium spiritivorum]EEI90222.1 hypothetical protein HMPREF0765_4173 [Sphingobacterium spiritivorum ATCC 33300]QQS95145.1 hypothetical protein I6J03_17445 [Sphingobacterium spiritivorum]
MSELENTTFFFSVAEKKAFLEKEGYTFDHRLIEKEVNLYQNVFKSIQTTELVVIKEGAEQDIHKAFIQALKTKLLRL